MMENKRGYDLKEYLRPVWNTNKIVNETVMFLGESDEAPFIYKPDCILSVKNYNLNKEYVENKDYVIENGKIKRIPGGEIPFFKVEDYYTVDPGKYAIEVEMERALYKFEDKRYLAYGEEDTFTKYQIAVSYTHSQKWQGAIPADKSNKLPKTHEKLQNGERLAVTFYGDSIMTGCNSSGTPMGGNVPPYMEDYPNMIACFLREKFGSEVEMSNVSQGGWNTYEGLAAFDERVLPTKPDLLVIGFGMNDLLTPLDEFEAMIEKMILRLREENPHAEVLLVATMWPNVESTWVRNQVHTLQRLINLEERYASVAVADLTTFHEDVLATGKRYRDMTANNINHPNDFFARFYAQVILTALLGENYI